MYVYRYHIIPNEVTTDSFVSLYREHTKRTGVMMTSFEMDRFIRSRWRRNDVWWGTEMLIEVPNQMIQLQATLSDSIDQLWVNTRPSTDEYYVYGKITLANAVCSICKEESGVKIRLHNCKCIFHRQCISTAVKYGDLCPVCKSSIYKRKTSAKTNADDKKTKA